MKLKTLVAAAALALAALTSASARAAVPATLTHEGRLLDNNGQPVTTSQIFIYKIYAAATGGTAMWTETLTVTFDQGYFSVQLGTMTAIPNSLLTSGPVYLGIQVGTDPEMTPREQLTSVPYARIASDVSGDIHPTSVSVAGATVIDNTGKWTGAIPASIGACISVDGPCGVGTFGQPTYFLDRVGGNCPTDHPVFNGFKFFRCPTPPPGDATEGLALRMTCCALQH
jgi:hypothetical protein